MAKNKTITTVTIANGGSTSTAVTLGASQRLIAVVMPSSFTGTALTFEQSTDDGTTYNTVYNESTAYSLTTAGGRYHSVNPLVFDGALVVRVVSGSTEGAARSIKLIAGEA